MSPPPLRVGLIGADANTRYRYIPGIRALSGVEIVAVCNRRPASTASVALEYGIPRTRDRWEDVVEDTEIDAVMIGTWPYLHAPITVAALAAGKHVLTEARLSIDAAGPRTMLEASRANPQLVAQVVASPPGLKGDAEVRRLLADRFLGTLREIEVVGRNATLADPAAPFRMATGCFPVGGQHAGAWGST